MKTYIFQPNGHGELTFITKAENEKEAFDKVDKHIKDNQVTQISGWGTSYYTCKELLDDEVFEHSND